MSGQHRIQLNLVKTACSIICLLCMSNAYGTYSRALVKGNQTAVYEGCSRRGSRSELQGHCAKSASAWHRSFDANLKVNGATFCHEWGCSQDGLATPLISRKVEHIRVALMLLKMIGEGWIAGLRRVYVDSVNVSLAVGAYCTLLP